MPNWCYISAVISHNDAEKIGELALTLENEDTFEHFIPVPKELVEQTDPDVLAIGITTLGSDEYDWRVSNWGTKWDICRSEIIDREDKMLLIQFETDFLFIQRDTTMLETFFTHFLCIFIQYYNRIK